MRNENISIMDKNGKTFTIYVSTPSIGAGFEAAFKKGIARGAAPTMGNWKAMNQGFIRYNFGKTRVRNSDNGDATTRDC